MKAHMDQQAKILVSKSLNHPYMPPTERVRRRTHVTRKEWEAIWLAVSPPVKIASVEKSSLKFCAKLYRAMHKLATRLGYSEEDHEQLRLYLTEVVQISPHHSLILIFPSIDRVCLPPTANDPTPPGCAWCSMAFFERHLGITYDPKFHRRAYTLLAMLELLVPISNFMQRQCISDSEWTKCSERTNALQSLLQTVDALLSEKRWLSDAIGTARDRKRIYPATLNMGEMKRYLELSVASKLKEESSVELTNIVSEKLVEETKKYSTMSSVDSLVNSLSAKIRRHTDETFSNGTENVRLKGIDIVTRSAPISRGDEKPANVLRIYVEYPTGLPHGICVRVSAKLTTTSRDIVEMTVHRVAQTVKQKSLLQNPRWLNEHECGSFVTPDLCCLVVNLGTVERKLLSTVRPLLLQHPWRSGRFCVRLMKNVHSSITRTNSPVNVYLAAAQNAQILNTQPMFYPVRTYKARITEVLTSCIMATISPPPTVYVNGLPIQNHDNRNC
ncbi:unnamed protein product [Dicrocoelium dendriticum]|nr:unnamed protein product [Dicrocoelium dendriticum]